jgi:tetratricopeptide (TPR) repeat protein
MSPQATPQMIRDFGKAGFAAIAAAVALMMAPTGSARADDADVCSNASGDVAIAACTRAIDSGRLTRENLVVTFYNRGMEYRAKGNYAAAITDYGSALAIDPNYLAAWNNRGLAKKESGDLDGAFADYSQAIRLKADYAFGYNNRGVVLREKGDLDGALRDFDRAIAIDPGYVATYTNRGLTHERRGDSMKARADFAQALKLPDKHSNSTWAKNTAQEHLRKLGN